MASQNEDSLHAPKHNANPTHIYIYMKNRKKKSKIAMEQKIQNTFLYLSCSQLRLVTSVNGLT